MLWSSQVLQKTTNRAQAVLASRVHRPGVTIVGGSGGCCDEPVPDVKLVELAYMTVVVIHSGAQVSRQSSHAPG